MTDVRGATHIRSLVFVPFMLVFVAGVARAIALNTDSLLDISDVVVIVDLTLFYLSTSTFMREEIFEVEMKVVNW